MIKSCKSLEMLVPVKDDEGILRVSGRLENSQIFNVEKKHPKILPRTHRISRLIVKNAHKKTFHPGHLRVMAECRNEYWIIGLRQLSK